MRARPVHTVVSVGALHVAMQLIEMTPSSMGPSSLALARLKPASGAAPAGADVGPADHDGARELSKSVGRWARSSHRRGKRCNTPLRGGVAWLPRLASFQT